MGALRVLYWFVTGAVLGMGLVELPGLGLILFPIGVVLLVIGLIALRGREGLAGIVGFGALPTALFVNAIVISPSSLSQPFYLGGLIIFGAITLIGLVAFFVVPRAKSHGPRPGTT